MKYAKQIEIKLNGNDCLINIPIEQNKSLKSINKILTQNNNTFISADDMSFNVSCTSEDNMNSKNTIYNNDNYEKENDINHNNNDDNEIKNYICSNENSKLEITYQSIFFSDFKNENSNTGTPLLLLNSNNDSLLAQKKDPVVKRINFDTINNNNCKNKNNNSNNHSNCSGSSIIMNNISNIQKEVLKNINKISTEIQNISIRKLPSINKNNIENKISKNLNKEYFIHEKIICSDKNKNNDSNKELKNLEKFKIDKKIKENFIKNGTKIKSNFHNKSFSGYNKKKNNNEMKNGNVNINSHQIFQGGLSRFKSNQNFLIKNKSKKNQDNIIINNKIDTNFLLNKCSSKPNLSNMKNKLNNMLKFKQKCEKENLKINTDNNNNNKETVPNEIEIKKIKLNSNILLNKKEKNIDHKKCNPRIASANCINTSKKMSKLKSYNSYNHSAKISKLQKKSLQSNNSNFKTPFNKQLILCNPNTNSYCCSTAYSTKNNKSPRNNSNKCFDTKNSDLKNENSNNYKNELILCKVEAHNSLLKNFFLNPHNYKKQEKSDDFVSPKNFMNKKETEIKIGNHHYDENFNKNKMSLRKYNTDLKIPLKNNNQIDLLTERNINNNLIQKGNNKKNNNDLHKLFRKSEYDFESLNSFKK